VQDGLVLVEVLDELGDASAVVELVRALGLLTLVLDGDADALIKNAFSRRRSESLSKLNSDTSKISGSGLNVIFVPRRRVLPVISSFVLAMPLLYSCS